MPGREAEAPAKGIMWPEVQVAGIKWPEAEAAQVQGSATLG